MESAKFNPLKEKIQQEAAQCVKCGLCLPYCPTYTQTQNECESPRGRIALADGYASNQIPLSKKAQLYLDHCLTCRACEAVCPANVAYGSLIDHTRALQKITQATTIKLPKSLSILLFHPFLQRIFRYFLHFYQKSGLQVFAKKSGLLTLLKLTRANALLPDISSPVRLQDYYSAEGQEQGRVALFTGCANQLFDQETIISAIKVLTACGYGVYVPRQQLCCGALHQHAGDTHHAQKLRETNYQAFQLHNIQAIITLATGCGATLQEYPHHEFADKIIDITVFLTQITWPATLHLKPLSARVAIHTPCTLRNVIKQPMAPIQLLKKIPEIELCPPSAQKDCCGAAGLYMLEYPDMADALVEKTLAIFIEQKPDFIVTTNIGCSLHMARTLREKQSITSIVHPITLLAKQL